MSKSQREQFSNLKIIHKALPKQTKDLLDKMHTKAEKSLFEKENRKLFFVAEAKTRKRDYVSEYRKALISLLEVYVNRVSITENKWSEFSKQGTICLKPKL